MCGIFGLISRGGLSASKNQAKKLLSNFYKLLESRGKEPSGACLLIDKNIDVVKAPI